jgi:predicted Zn-dependent protease with MMP-like domain
VNVPIVWGGAFIVQRAYGRGGFAATLLCVDITDEQFEKLIAQAMDELPTEYIERLDNVAVTYADDPDPEQRQKLRLRGGDMLFGLYEGIPLTRRTNNYSFVLPDKITLFKNPMLRIVHDVEGLKRQVKHTLWHEIAHYYGLDHDRIHEIERNWQ